MQKLTLSIPWQGGQMKVDEGLPQGVPHGGLSTNTGQNIFMTLIELLIVIAILFALLLIVRGGINMMTSGGDKQRFTAGRERIRYAILGLVIIFLSFFLVNILGTFFGIDLLSILSPQK